MKTDYFLHDGRYRKLRQTDNPGWDNAETLAKNLTQWRSRLEAPYLPKQGRALELGCGAGDLTLMMAEMGFLATGIDISPTAIDWAREKALQRGVQADFLVGNVCDLSDFSSGAFDVVLDGHCLHCIVGEDRRRVLEETRRMLRPGGYLLVLTMIGAPPESHWARVGYDPTSCCQVWDGVALRYYVTQDRLLAELRQSGFAAIGQGELPAADSESHPRIWIDAMRADNVGAPASAASLA